MAIERMSKRRSTTQNGRLLISALALAPFLGGCSGDYLMQKMERNEGDGWIDMGDGCIHVSNDGSTTGGGLGSDDMPGEPDAFELEMVSTGGKVTVTITTASREEVLVFDRKFIRSGEKQVTEITTDAGTTYRLTHWGGPECDVRSEEELAVGGASPDR